MVDRSFAAIADSMMDPGHANTEDLLKVLQCHRTRPFDLDMHPAVGACKKTNVRHTPDAPCTAAPLLMTIVRSGSATEGYCNLGLHEAALEGFCPIETKNLGRVSRYDCGSMEPADSCTAAAAAVRREAVDCHRMSLTEAAGIGLGDTPLEVDPAFIYLAKRKRVWNSPETAQLGKRCIELSQMVKVQLVRVHLSVER